MQIPLIGKVGWKLSIGLIVVAAVFYAILVYGVQKEMGKTLVWCATKWEKCSISREVDQKQINQLRIEAGL